MELGSVTSGAVFMAAFGLGTIPMMVGVNLMGNNLNIRKGQNLSRLIKIFVLIMGILFIIRGLGLGIPFLSPKLVNHATGVECHLPEHRHY